MSASAEKPAAPVLRFDPAADRDGKFGEYENSLLTEPLENYLSIEGSSMHRQHFLKTLLLAATASVLLAGICPQVQASGTSKDDSLALRKSMQEMGKDMQVITDGISREDWTLVAKSATRINAHPPLPVSGKMRILAFVGQDVARFKIYDERSHTAAQKLEQVAERKDGQAVIASFAALQNTCLGCHQIYRKSFLDHFHGQD